MGVKGTRRKRGEAPIEQKQHKWTEQEIQRMIRYKMFSPNALKYRMENLIVFDWESDSLMVTKSGYYYEYEIKISRQDFRNDKKKKDKHLMLEGKPVYDKWTNKEVPRKCPNYFSYVVPEGLIREDEVPSYAGLYYVKEDGTIIAVKAPPRLHSEKWTDEELGLIKKFYYNYLNWKEQKELDLERMQQQLNEAKSVDGKHYSLTLPEAMKRIGVLNDMVDRLTEQKKDLYQRLVDACDELRTIKRSLHEKNN